MVHKRSAHAAREILGGMHTTGRQLNLLEYCWQ